MFRVFIVNVERISYIVSIVGFEQANTGWENSDISRILLTSQSQSCWCCYIFHFQFGVVSVFRHVKNTSDWPTATLPNALLNNTYVSVHKLVQCRARLQRCIQDSYKHLRWRIFLFHVERRGNDRFHVVSMWNTRGVFVGLSDRATTWDQTIR